MCRDEKVLQGSLRIVREVDVGFASYLEAHALPLF